MAAADLCRIRGLDFLFILLCGFAFASSPTNGTTLEEVKASYEKALENYERTKTNYQVVNLYTEKMMEYTHELEYLLALDANNDKIRLRLDELKGDVEMVRRVKKQGEELFKKMKETEDQLELQGEMIKCLDKLPKHSEL